MYTFEIRFYPKTFEEPFIDEYNDDMINFISSLVLNGQVLSDFQNSVKLGDCYAHRVIAPEADSLDEKQ